MASKRSSRPTRLRSHRGTTTPKRRYNPSLEVFEERLLLSGFTYNADTGTDSGSGSGLAGDLRYCITQANGNPGSTIDVTSVGLRDVVGSALPALTADVTIVDSVPGTFIIRGGDSGFNALTVNAGVTATIDGLDFQNFSASSGGGILDVSGTLTLNNSLLNVSSGPSGGAVFVSSSGTLTANNDQIQSDSSTGAGGGIYNDGYLDLLGGSIQSNTSDGNGGGVFSEGHMNANGVEVSGNSSSDNGGGIEATSAFGTPGFTLTNSTVANNTASEVGGGIFLGSAQNVILTNDTIAGNNATVTSTDGGGIYDSDSSYAVVLNNTIVAQNFGGEANEDDVDGVGDAAFNNSHSNFLGDNSVNGISNGSNGNQVGTSGTPLNAGLNSLTNNGGNNQTMASYAGSPVIGTGNVGDAIDPAADDAALQYDQRGVGFSRTSTGGTLVDIGAYQTQNSVAASALAVTTATGTYGGFTTVSATLTSSSVGVSGELVDFHIGSTDLGSAITNSSGVATISNVALTSANLGSIAAGDFSGDVTASFGGDSSYAASNGAGSLDVNPASLTITANNKTKVYGAALPTLTDSFAGLVNGDTAASLGTLPTNTTTATAASHVVGNPYSITASGAVDPNYTISYVAGSLNVTTAALTITATNKTKVYGASLPTLTDSFTGLVNGDTAASLGTLPTITTTATAASHVAGNPYSISASGAVDTDYAISYVGGSLNVTTAPLTITANNQTKVYGAALPTLTGSFSGFVNGDTAASLATLPSLTTTATSASHVAGNPYSITASGAVDTDYAISYVAGSLNVTTAPLTITANNQTKVYGAALPTLTGSFSGFVNGDTAASLATLPLLTTTATSASHVAGNPYSITASGAVDTDYTINYVPGSLIVMTAPLTITANNQTKVYGAALPTLTGSFSGFVNGDTAASLATLPSLTTTATSASHVAGNPYSITASGAVDTDYTINYVPGSLIVMTAPLTITANNQTKVYGAALPTLTASYSGLVNGDTPASLGTLPSLSTAATSASHVEGNPYSITASEAADPDYAISYVPGVLIVTSAPLTVTADNQTKVYGAALPTLTASYSGLVNGDTSASLGTLPSLSTTATSASHVLGNPYSITASGAVDPDYSISYVAGSLNVTAAPLTITPDNQAKVYGAALPTLTASYTGLVNGDTPASLGTLPTISTTATSASHVLGSPYVILATNAADSDYAISYVPGLLTVTTAPLTVTADNLTKTYGAALPTLTASYSGLVNGDTSASLAILPTLTTTATSASHVAGNPYSITASSAADTDYTISYVDGSLTVTTAPLTITADNQTKVYGAALPTLTASYTGFVNGDTSASLGTLPSLTTTATSASHVEGNPYSITASEAVDTDYTISYVAGSLNVTTAPLTITADNQTKVYGAALPTLTASYSGLVNGDTSASLGTLPSLTTTASSASHVLGNPYSITASSAVDTDYTISYVDGSLNVTTAPLTITADNQTKVYGAAVPFLSVGMAGLVNGDNVGSLTTQPTITTTATSASHVAGNPYAITASGAVDTDYTISYVAGSLNVTTAPLTITANNQAKVYGAALPILTASYSGLVNGDTSASLSTLPTVTTTATAASHVSPLQGNPFVVTAFGAVDPDYAISYTPGSLIVTPAPLTITADNQTKVYGAALPTLTASYAGFVNGDTSASLSTLPTLGTTATAASHIADGPYAIFATNTAVDPDYTISYVNGSLAITPAPLTVTADDQTKVYGAALPTLTASYTGLINGDTATSLATPPTLTTTATAASDVSGNPFAISVIGAVDPDYSISYVAGTLNVTPAPLTITADDQANVYGDALPSLTASYSGFVNGDTSANLATLPMLTTTATSSSHVAGGPYAISAIGAVDPDYSISYVAGTLNVTPAPLTVTADDQTKVYGAGVPALTASYSGFVNGDTSASLSAQTMLTTAATAASHVAGSPYAIIGSGAIDSDYTISYVNGTLTVTPTPLTITADNQSKVYGAALPTLTSSFSGFVNGDTSASLATPPTLSTTATAGSDVSNYTYPVMVSGAIDPDYTITYLPGALTVTPAPLNVVINNQTKVFGQANPPLTATVTGILNSDDVVANLTTSATQSSIASSTGYPITLSSLSGAKAEDYSTTVSGGSVTDGTLVVTPTPATPKPVQGDYNNDGKADLAIYLPSLGEFAIRPSSGGPDEIVPFGLSGAGQTIPAPGDYFGTGQTDIAAYLPSLGEFAIRNPNGTPDQLIPFGLSGAGQTIPAPGDYFGNGQTDVAAYLPSLGEFAIRNPNGTPDQLIPFGLSGAGQTIPAPGDYFGTGQTDIAAYLPSLGEFAIRNPNGGPDQLIPFGMAGAGKSIPMPGDYDGSGKTELAVYMPSLGVFVYRPANGGPDVMESFGVSGQGQTLPAAGDYNGNGHDELAAYLPGTGDFAIRQGGGQPDIIESFGIAGPGQTIPVTVVDEAIAGMSSTQVSTLSIAIPDPSEISDSLIFPTVTTTVSKKKNGN